MTDEREARIPARIEPGAPALAPARARTFYAVADAFGAGDRDLAPALVRWLATAPSGERRALLRFLVWLEHAPRTTPAGRHGFAWLPREARLRWLERVARSPLPGVADAAATLRRLVVEARQSPPGP